MIPDETHALVWVTQFPLFEYDETEKRLSAVHHPFTAPLEEDLELLKSNPGNGAGRCRNWRGKCQDTQQGNPGKNLPDSQHLS